MQPNLSKVSASCAKNKIKKELFIFFLPRRSLTYQKLVQIEDNTRLRLNGAIFRKSKNFYF